MSLHCAGKDGKYARNSALLSLCAGGVRCVRCDSLDTLDQRTTNGQVAPRRKDVCEPPQSSKDEANSSRRPQSSVSTGISSPQLSAQCKIVLLDSHVSENSHDKVLSAMRCLRPVVRASHVRPYRLEG